MDLNRSFEIVEKGLQLRDFTSENAGCLPASMHSTVFLVDIFVEDVSFQNVYDYLRAIGKFGLLTTNSNTLNSYTLADSLCDIIKEHMRCCFYVDLAFSPLESIEKTLPGLPKIRDANINTTRVSTDGSHHSVLLSAFST